MKEWDGLSYEEVMFIGALLSKQDSPNEYIVAWEIKGQMKKYGLNDVAFNICTRKLVVRGIVDTSMVFDYNGNEYVGYNLTESGNEWIIRNTDKFSFED